MYCMLELSNILFADVMIRALTKIWFYCFIFLLIKYFSLFSFNRVDLHIGPRKSKFSARIFSKKYFRWGPINLVFINFSYNVNLYFHFAWFFYICQFCCVFFTLDCIFCSFEKYFLKKYFRDFNANFMGFVSEKSAPVNIYFREKIRWHQPWLSSRPISICLSKMFSPIHESHAHVEKNLCNLAGKNRSAQSPR